MLILSADWWIWIGSILEAVVMLFVLVAWRMDINARVEVVAENKELEARIKAMRGAIEELRSDKIAITQRARIELEKLFDKPLARDCRHLTNELEGVRRCLDKSYDRERELRTQLEEAVEAANEAERKLFEGEAKWFSEVVKDDVVDALKVTAKGGSVPYQQLKTSTEAKAAKLFGDLVSSDSMAQSLALVGIMALISSVVVSQNRKKKGGGR